MKFVTFLKIFGICFLSLIGVCGVGVGVTYLVGGFRNPDIMPENLQFVEKQPEVNEYFEVTEYNVDNDFKVTIKTSTENVSRKNLTLSLSNQYNTVVDKGNSWSDGVIEIPKTAKIDEEFTVKLVRKENDSETGGLSWIAGGHSVIRATSENPTLGSKHVNVNVDVPVYSVDVITKVSEADEDAFTFVIDSVFNASLKFYPQRSAYQYSYDGKNNFATKLKNAYFMLASVNDELLTQIGNSNQFRAVKVGVNSTILGYCFTSTLIEENTLKLYSNLDEQTRYARIMEALKTMSSDVTSLTKSAITDQKSVEVINITVDSLTSAGEVNDVFVDTIHKLYANKTIEDTNNASNLGIRLLSKYDGTVSLQNKLTNVALRFLYKQGNNYVDAIESGVISIDSVTGYSKQLTVEEDEENKTYYYPVITSSVDDYYWQFATNRTVDAGSLYIEIRYFDEAEENNIESVTKSFSTKTVIASPVSWNDTSSYELKIYDGQTVDYAEFDLAPRTQVPLTNLYQQKKYFAYVNEGNVDLSEYINVGAGKQYNLGTQSYTLFELPDGIVQAKNLQAHGLSFNVVFATIETNYKSEPKLDNGGNYIISQYSKDDIGTISAIRVNVYKTLKQINASINTNNELEDIITFKDNEEDLTTNLAFVEKSTNPFDVLVSCSDIGDETENEIFERAMTENKIKIVGKVNGIETDIISCAGTNKEELGNNLFYRFSMKVNSLPIGTPSIKIKLYVHYDDSLGDDQEITNCVNDDQELLLGYIEIYNGEATIFNFNINLNDDYKSSESNRIVVSSKITQTGDNIEDITTSYMLNGQDVSTLLFVTSEDVVDYSSLNIALLDKHNRKPVLSTYTLRSTNQSVMKISGQNTITFVGKGSVELELIDSFNVVRDKLYFEATEAGQVIEVNKLVETVESNVATKSVENEFTYDETNSYSFPQITVPVVGFSGSRITLNSTLNSAINLITYKYQYKENNALKSGYLTAKTVFSLIADENDRAELEKLIEFHLDSQTDSYLLFKKDFGTNKTIQILASVPELGISQIILLDIRPNVTILVTPVNNPVAPESLYGIQVYTGVYADSIYRVKVEMQYSVIQSTTDSVTLDTSSYAFYVYDPAQPEQQKMQLTQEKSQYGYITKQDDLSDGKITFARENLNDNRFVANVNIVFVSQKGFKDLIISFEKQQINNDSKSTYDSIKYLYIYINPNIQIQATTDIIYLSTSYQNMNTYYEYGKTTIFGNGDNSPLKISRIVNNSDDIDENIAKIDENLIKITLINQNNFILNKYELISTSALSNPVRLTFEATYDEFGIGENRFGQKSFVTLTVAPNIQIDYESNNWVTYDSQQYLKLVNNKTYTVQDLIKSFSYDNNNSQSPTIEITPLNSFIVINNENSYLIQNVVDRLIFSSENNEAFKIKITLYNNYSMTFDIILVPSDLPFAIYRDVEGNIVEFDDLKDMLDVEYLKQHSELYTYELTNAGNEEGTIITFNLQEGNIPENAIGVQAINGASYSVKNLNESDDNIYAYFDTDKNVLITEPVGQDTYIILYENLNPLSSASLVIPYLIKIKHELEIKFYYPYLEGESSNEEISNSSLAMSNVNFDMEYLSFNNGTAQIDMLENLNSDIPNKAQNSRRFIIGRNGETSFEEVLQSSIKFEITELYYKTAQWHSAQNIRNYANITEQGVLTITQNNTNAIRLKLEITTPNGILGWYYVSVGEIPQMTLSQQRTDGTSTTEIEDIRFMAESEKPSLAVYKLSQFTSITTDITSMLRFYAINKDLNIDTENKEISAQSTQKDWTTQLVFYTKYGMIKKINVNVLSNYEVTANFNQVYSGTIISITNDFTAVKKVEGATQNPTIIRASQISIVKDVNDQYNYDKIISVDAQNIIVYLVDTTTTVKISIKFELDDNGQTLEYDYIYNLTILPSIKVADYNGEVISRNNMFNLNNEGREISANSEDNLIDLNSLFTFTKQEGQFEQWLKECIEKNIFEVKATVISEISGRNNYTFELQGTNISMSVPEVADVTTVMVKVDLINKCNDNDYVAISSYFVFSVKPNFKVKINYPQPNSVDNVDREYYYIGENTFSLLESHILMPKDSTRIQITNVDDEPLSDISKFYISVSATDCVVKNSDKVVDGEIKLTEATSFTFDTSLASSDVIFYILYEVADGQRYSVASYNLTVTNNISNVWTVSTRNFNNTVEQNSRNNYENIYVGTDDNVMNKVKVTINVPFDVDLSSDKYIQITTFGGVKAVTGTRIKLYDGVQGQKINVFMYIDATTTFTDNTILYSTYSSAEGTDETTLTSKTGQPSRLSFEDIVGRVTIYYHGYPCEFTKAYNILSIDNLNVNNSLIEQENILSQPIEIQQVGKIGEYYLKYLFDIDFDNTTINIEAGQTLNILGAGINPGIENLNNHLYSINLKRMSDKQSYTLADFSLDGFHLYIDNASYGETNNKSYIRISPYQNGTNEEDSYIYDYLIVANGAPNESVEVKFKLTIIFGTNQKDYDFTLIVSNDYENLSLRNIDNIDNSSIHRNEISLTSVNQNFTFAKRNSLIPSDNFIYITHRNKVAGREDGNMAPFFNSIFDLGGEYITRVDSNDLVFNLKNIEFGNQNINIRFEDEYGYTFNYYITVIAKYNPTYDGARIDIYENDEVYVYQSSQSTTTSAGVMIPINIKKTLGALANPSLLLNVDVNFVTENKESIKCNTYDISVTLAEFAFDFQFPQFALDYFGNSNRISGTLQFVFTPSDSSYGVTLSIPVTVIQRYSLQTIDGNEYVRDGVEFSVLEVIDVVDNKQNYKVGSVTLENIDSAVISYELTEKDSTGKKLTFDDINNFTLQIEAYYANNAKTFISAVYFESNKTSTYVNLQNLFDITSISNYEFRLVYFDNNGQKQYIYDSEHNLYKLQEQTEGEYVATTEITVGDKSYNLKVKGYLVKDQELKIGVRSLTNNNSFNVYFTKNKTLTVQANTNGILTYSLVKNSIIQSGNYVELFNGDKNGELILNGLSIQSIMTLKGIKINSISENDLNDNLTITQNLKSDKEFKVINDGKEISYQDGNISINLDYGFYNNTYTKTNVDFDAPIRITPRFVGVDKVGAYGSNGYRVVNIDNLEQDDGKYNLDIKTWAGTTSRQFDLIAGYSNSAYRTTENLVLSANSDYLTFKINTAQSSNTIVNYVSIDGSNIIINEEFNITNNFVAVDIFVKYGQEGNIKEIKIDTVTIVLAQPNVSDVKMIDESRPLYVDIEANDQGTFSASLKIENLINIIQVSDTTGRIWYNEDIYLFSSKLKAKFTYAETNFEMSISNNTQHNFSLKKEDYNIKLQFVSASDNNTNYSKEFSIKLSNQKFDKNSLTENIDVNYYTGSYNKDDENIKQQIANATSANLTFIDNLGYENNLTFEYKKLDNQEVGKYYYTIENGTKDGIKNGETDILTISYYEKVHNENDVYAQILLGTLNVHVYSSSNVLTKTSSYSGNEIEINSILDQQIIVTCLDGDVFKGIELEEGQKAIYIHSDNVSYILLTNEENKVTNEYKINDEATSRVASGSFVYIYDNNNNNIVKVICYTDAVQEKSECNNIYDVIKLIFGIEEQENLYYRCDSNSAKIENGKIIVNEDSSSFTFEVYQIINDYQGESKDIVYFKNSFTRNA